MAGFLFDKVGYSKLMSACGVLLTINLASIYFVGQQSFIGLIISVWLVYFLGFTHFSTIPAQALKLYPGPNSYVVFGCIGLGETFSYALLAILNSVCSIEKLLKKIFDLFHISRQL